MHEDFIGRHEAKLEILEKKTDKIETKVDTILELITQIRIDLMANRVKLAIYASATALIVSGIVTIAIRTL